MTLESLQAKVKKATESHLRAAAAETDKRLHDLSAKWAETAGDGEPTAETALRLASLVEHAAGQAIETMARLGVAHGLAEVRVISNDAAPHGRIVAGPSTYLLSALAMGMAERIQAGKRAAFSEGERIVDTESFSAYNRGRFAVEIAMASASRSYTATRDAKDWIPAIAVRWDALLDRRTCKVCAGADGTIRPLGGTFDGGPIPPKHSRCRCCAQFWPIAIPKNL